VNTGLLSEKYKKQVDQLIDRAKGLAYFAMER
jgi:hypothetical protein